MKIVSSGGSRGQVKGKKLIKQIKRHLEGKPMIKNDKK